MSSLEFSTSKDAELELNALKTNIDSSLPHDMILGAKALSDLGIDLHFKENYVKWDETCIEIKSEAEVFNLKNAHKLHHLCATSHSNKEPEEVKEASNCAECALDAACEKANVKKIVQDCMHLTVKQKNSLLNLLLKDESLFDGTLGNWKTNLVFLGFKPSERSYYGKACPVPHVYEKTSKTEDKRLISIGVLEKYSDSEWGSPTFVIPKKNGTTHFIADLRQVNKRIA